MTAVEVIQPLATSYLGTRDVTGRSRDVLRSFVEGHYSDRQGLEALLGQPDAPVPHDLTEFFLFCVREMLADHALSTEEKSAAGYLKRLFRLDEGTLARTHQQEVGGLLAMELGRVLEDRRVDAAEAMHQVDLQEVLGLGYDQYLELARPHVYQVLLHLVNQIDADQDRLVTEQDLAWYHRQLAGLDTVFNLNPDQQLAGTEPGYLYVLVNPSMEGIVKIGKTTRSPILRARELGASTGVPTPFMLIFDVAVANCSAAERYVHEHLQARGLRLADNREFFRVSPPEAIALVQEARAATV